MVTLHIEHAITDLAIWLGAFARFEEARRQAGVRAERIFQPADDEHYIYVQLDFDAIEQAAAFKLAAWQRIFGADQKSPQMAIMGQYFLQHPTATAEEAAEFAKHLAQANFDDPAFLADAAEKLIRFGHDEGKDPHLYYVTLFVSEKRIYVLEAGGTKSEIERQAAQIDWAIANFLHKV